MSDISCILYSGVYEVLVDYLDYNDVYELALVSVEWGNYLGGSFIRYWQKASINMFGFRLDLARSLANSVVDNKHELEKVNHLKNINSWFRYFELLSTSDLGIFLINQKRTNRVLQALLYNLKIDLNSANSCFSMQNSPNLKDIIAFRKFINHYTTIISDTSNSETLPYPFESLKKHNLKDHLANDNNQSPIGLTSFTKIELDFGGLGKGYLWDMEVYSITSQNVILKSELMIEDIPYWDIGKVIMDYIAVWGLVNENEHVLLYHHKNPFHRIDNKFQSNSNKISEMSGINYFLSSLSSFAGIEMSVNETLSKITIYVTLQVVFIFENLRNHFSSHSKTLLNFNQQIKSIQDFQVFSMDVNHSKEDLILSQDFIHGIDQDKMCLDDNNIVLLEEFKTKKDLDNDLLDFQYEYDNISTQESLLLTEDECENMDGNHLALLPTTSSLSILSKDQLEPNFIRDKFNKCQNRPSFSSHRYKLKSSLPFKYMNNIFTRSYYNIELQLMDTRASIPMYLYGDLEPLIENTSRDFAELRVYFGRNYPNSNFIKTNCLYQAGISVIDKVTGEIVFSLVFPKSKSYYDRRAVSSKSRRLLKLCSYSRVYSTQVPVIDPPSQLTNMPESVFTKLEILIHPQKSTLGKVSELSVSLNVKECQALFPFKKFKRFLSLQGFQSQDQYKRRINSPIKNIHKY